MAKLEGSGISQLTQIIKHVGRNDFDRFEVATVTAAPPALKVKLDSTALELLADDIIVAEHLTEHKRRAQINGGADVDLVLRTGLAVGDRVILVSMNEGQSYVLLDKAVGY